MAKVPRMIPKAFIQHILIVFPWIEWDVVSEKFMNNIKAKNLWKKNFFANFFNWDKTPEGVDYWRKIDSAMMEHFGITDEDVMMAAVKWAEKKAKKQSIKDYAHAESTKVSHEDFGCGCEENHGWWVEIAFHTWLTPNKSKYRQLIEKYPIAKKQTERFCNLHGISMEKALNVFDTMGDKEIAELTALCESEWVENIVESPTGSIIDEAINTPEWQKALDILADSTWKSRESLEASIRIAASVSPDHVKQLGEILNIQKLWLKK